MRRILFLLLFFIASKSYATDSLATQKHFHKIYFYSVGLESFSPEMTVCGNEQAAKMGFGFKIKGGCVVGRLKFKRVQSHNYRVEKKLVKRFGEDWRKQYDKLLLHCKA